jgi:phosphoribosylformimino-5-aminoimidazole carboxamide ribotide isomerase
MDDILKLNEMEVPGVIVGKAIYENRITLSEIEMFIV